ncbi:MAG: pyridoxal-dependent decarboxylase, partial [Actinomycetota bacterium]|nr:pyridoxal-dependent decarboxylase [Actinomycetota bacterium]
MSAGGEPYSEALATAARRAAEWLASLPDRHVGPAQSAHDLAADFGGPLPELGMPAAAVVEYLADKAEPGLMAMPSGRFFGWVIGGTLPAALAADWLVSAWDQNSGLRYATPAIAAIEEGAGHWLLDLLGLPAESDVGFTTGATMANFTGLAAARWRLLADAGWDLDGDGLAGAPRIRCFVGQERHETIDLGLRYLGLGRPTAVPADAQGRLVAAELDRLLSEGSGPALVCLQAGNLHSGAFDPFDAAIEVARRHGAWVHVDGAFGLWAAAVPEFADLTRGMALADSWGTDAHKTLNVPYDCGIAIVRDSAALRSAMGLQHTSY